MPTVSDAEMRAVRAAARAWAAARRREQAQREGLLAPEPPPVSPRFQRYGISEIERAVRGNFFLRAPDGQERAYFNFLEWSYRPNEWPSLPPMCLNPIPPDLADLVCSALDEALVYVEPIDDDEPWDDDGYVEVAPAEPARPVPPGVATYGSDVARARYRPIFSDELDDDADCDF